MPSKFCKICGAQDCKKHSILIGKPLSQSTPQFSGSSPPEIFVGKWNYPNIYTGILSPQEYGQNQEMSSPELWHSKKLPISKIMEFRNKLIYARTQSNIKKNTKFLDVMKEIAMTHKSAATEFKLEKAIKKEKHPDSRVPLISNAAPAKSARLEENTKVKKKVDYLVNDTDVKSRTAIQELHKSKIPVSNIIKILSAGLLGLKKNRKLVPTRWSITAVDSNISEKKLQKIKSYPFINDYLVFSSEYLGNHYEIILIPRYWSFEVIELSLKYPGGGVWQDHETIFKRKKYADSVTGAYYANRLAVTEYLEKIKRQASILILREIRPEYYAPLGVGILRETSRAAFQTQPKKFNTLAEALTNAQKRLVSPVRFFTQRSHLLKNMQQTTLNNFL